MESNIKIVNGVRYEVVPETNECDGCVGEDNSDLCMALSKCATRKIIWVKHESQPQDEWQGYKEIKYVPSVTQELKAFFGGKDYETCNFEEAKPSWDKRELPVTAEEDEEFKRMDTYDVVEKPKHYMLFAAEDLRKKEGIEVRDVIEKLVYKFEYQGYPEDVLFISDYVQLMQYLMRFMDKNGVEDLKKARWYLDKMIEAYE